MSYIPSPMFDKSILPEEAFSSFLCPSIFTKGGDFKPEKVLHDELGSWIRNAKLEGEQFLKNCRTYQDLDKAIDIIAGKLELATLPNTLSTIQVNTIKRDIREMAAILSNIRPSWVYEANSSKDPTWLRQAAIQNGLSSDWYKKAFVDLQLKKLLQWSLVEGTGYLSPIWNPSLHGKGRGGIELKVYRYNKVFPVQIGPDYDLQQAYGVIIVDEIPINKARQIFARTGKSQFIVPDRGMPESSQGWVRSSAKTFWDAISGADRKQTAPAPSVDILYVYVDDFSLNRTSSPIQMGDVGCNWSYEVPYIDQDIPDGYTKSGSLKTRKATLEDCYLYPNRRLIICTRTCILYDGPSYWWHGKVPIIKYSPDEWVWDYLGYSLAMEVYPLQRSSVSMRRDVEDALKLKIDPPVLVDEYIMAKGTAESKSLRMPGRRIRSKLAMGEAVKPVLSPQSYVVGQEHFNYVKETEDKIAHILGLPDLQSLAKARQVPGADTVEAFFSQAGEIVASMSRSMDKPIVEMADMNRYYFYQFYDFQRRIQVLGEDGMTMEDFDFEPGTLVPASMPNEPMENGVFKSSHSQKAKAHLANFSTTITPTSLHEITQMQRKLLHMQATKISPFLVDWETLAKELNIPNWGHLDGDTILEKVLSQMKIMEKEGLRTQYDQAMLQLMIQQIMMSQSPQGQLTQALQGIAGAASADIASKGAGGNPTPSPFAKKVGRPPDFTEGPNLVQRGDGSTTVTTS